MNTFAVWCCCEQGFLKSSNILVYITKPTICHRNALGNYVTCLGCNPILINSSITHWCNSNEGIFNQDGLIPSSDWFYCEINKKNQTHAHIQIANAKIWLVFKSSPYHHFIIQHNRTNKPVTYRNIVSDANLKSRSQACYLSVALMSQFWESP